MKMRKCSSCGNNTARQEYCPSNCYWCGIRIQSIVGIIFLILFVLALYAGYCFHDPYGSVIGGVFMSFSIIFALGSMAFVEPLLDGQLVRAWTTKR
jgi:hypothetical protein